MATANDIINRALRSLNVLGEAETASPATSSQGLDSLNGMLGDWSNSGALIYVTQTESFPFVAGQASYTIGPGANFNTVRPMEYQNQFVRWNGVDYPIGNVTVTQYQEILLKTVTSSIPMVMAVDTAFPTTSLLFWPTPSDTTATLYLETIRPFTEFANLNTVVALPPGYERALRLNLAVELMPDFGVQNPLLVQQAANAKSNIKTTNYKPIVLDVSPSIPQGGGYYSYRG